MRVPSPQACAWASVDPLKLNEAIARGFYPNAPTVGEGEHRRTFDDTDLIGLYVFGWRLRRGDTLRQAAGHASNVVTVCDDPRLEMRELYFAETSDGEEHVIFRAVGQEPGHGRKDVVCAEVVDLANIRKMIKQARRVWGISA